MPRRTALAIAACLLPLSWLPAASAQAASHRCHGLAATIVGTPRHDLLRGTPGRDVIVGLAGNDRISGRGGDDVICGGGGSDRIKGGAGDDRLYGGQDQAVDEGRYWLTYGDRLNGGRGDDLLDLGIDHRHPRGRGDETVSFQRSHHGVHVDLIAGTASGEGHDTIRGLHASNRWSNRVVGTRHDDVIVGGPERDWVIPKRGDDLVRGGGGDDLLMDFGDSGDRDRLVGGRGDDDLYSHSGPDILDGGTGRDFLVNKGSGETLLGGPGHDLVNQMVDAHQRRIDGGTGADKLVLIGLPRHTPVLGGPGRDSVRMILNDHAQASLDVGRGRLTQNGRSMRATSIHHWKLRAYDADLSIFGTPQRDEVGAHTRGSLTAALGAGNDRLHVQLVGHGIDAELGPGNDRVTVDREWNRPFAHRRFFGGSGFDHSHISGSGNHCVSIEKGNCPA
jgi:Ca2+-binding RTX toxin-like protein